MARLNAMSADTGTNPRTHQRGRRNRRLQAGNSSTKFPVEKEKETALTVGAHGRGGGGALQEHDAALQGDEDPQEARRRRSPPAPAHVEVEPSVALSRAVRAAAAAPSGEGPPTGYGRALPVLLPGRAMEESAPSLDAPAAVGRRGEGRRRRWHGRAQGRCEAAAQTAVWEGMRCGARGGEGSRREG
jgi:hypothetical protein